MNPDKRTINVNNEIRLAPPIMKPSSSTTLSNFRSNYDSLLKDVLEESSEDEDDLTNNMNIDINAATAELPEDLRAAIEDRALADKYLTNLKNFFNHRRSQSFNSEYSTPNTPLQTTFSNQPMLSPKPFDRPQPDLLSKVLDSVPYQTRLINGVPSLTLLEEKFHSLQIPELDLPVVSDTVIQTRLDGLYKIRDDLYIHLNGGPLVNSISQHNIGEKKKQKVLNLLDDVTKEIGLYEEFVKKANYLNLENILNEISDEEEFSDIINDVDSSLLHFDSSSDISKTSPGTPTFLSTSSPLRASSQFSFGSPILSQSTRNRPESSIGDDTTSRDSSHEFLDNEDILSSVKESIRPWEAFEWTRLRKISDQIYSDDVKMEFGLVSVIAVSGLIAIGTTRSLVFIYDYTQNLKCVLGDTTRAIELGSVTSLAISADRTTIACGHSQGYIVVWDIRKPTLPIRTIDPISPSQVIGALSAPQQQVPRKEGHVKGTSILHIGFVGVKKSDIVSGDDQGMAFYHALYKVIMVNAVDTTRILGRYQNLTLTPEIKRAQTVAANARLKLQSPSVLPKPRRPSTVFAMQPLPLGQIPHPAETFGLVALLTPYKMIIVGLKPTPQTLYKFLKPKVTAQPDNKIESNQSKANIESLSGCLAWLPSIKSGHGTAKENNKGKDQSPPLDPMLAFAWGNNLFILRVSVDNDKQQTTVNNRAPKVTAPTKSKKGTQLEFTKVGEWKSPEAIVSIQWINRQILVLFTPNEEMILFDPKNMVDTQQTSIRTKQLVYHDWFNTSLKDLVVDAANQSVDSSEQNHVLKSVEMAYFGSIKGYKGKLFLLGTNQIYIGTLLSWADRILALVQAGDYLECIQLATSFYNGIGIQTVIGLPEEDQARKTMVGQRLMELLTSSLNYEFSTRTMEDEEFGRERIGFQRLARACVQACLSMNNTEFLFETVYERFAENNVNGVFLEVLEPFIVEDQVSDLPPTIIKHLVDHYSRKRLLTELEQVIWHVNPRNLDIDQVVSMCHREGMYEAMMYVWNKSMHDYVSPVVEMLKVVRFVLRDENNQESVMRQNAEKLFDYLKAILTGRSFPDGSSLLPSDEASDARSAVYSFVFSGRCVVWPPVGGKLVLTADEDENVSEPTYPYLRLLLRFSTKKFLEAMEVAFQDPWLNGGEDILSSRFEDEVPGKVISRQIIVNTLLDVMGGGLTGNNLPPPRPKQSISASTVQSFSNTRLHITVPQPSIFSEPPSTYDYVSNENVILLYMFIASNLHLYTTFILLPPKTLHKVLVRLAENHDPDTRIERERAVQDLLTVFKPTNEEHIVGLYEEAGFWKVLEAVYRKNKKYGKLVEAYLKDEDRREMVFDCVQHLLGTPDLNDRQKEEVRFVFTIRISQFVDISGQKTAAIVEQWMRRDHADIIRRLEEEQEFDDEHHSTIDKRVFSYLRGLLEPYDDEVVQEGLLKERRPVQVEPAIRERYIELMCRFDPSGVYSYLNTLSDGEIGLDKVKESCERYGVIDAVVWIMEKSSDTQGALEKMLEVAKDKNDTILRILKQYSSDHFQMSYEDQNMINSCLIGLNGVLRVGTRLCENSSRSSVATYQTEFEESIEDEHLPELTRGGEDSSTGEDSTGHDEDLPVINHPVHDEVEMLWFRLLDAYVEGSIEMHGVYSNLKDIQPPLFDIHQRIVVAYKAFVQTILTCILLSTSPQVSLPRLLLRLIQTQTRGETTFADFRDIFLSMLDTYKYEGKLLEMTNRLFDRDLFNSLEDLVTKRGKGWRPNRTVCEICGSPIINLSLLQPPLAWGFEDEPKVITNEEEEAIEEEVQEDEQVVAPKVESIPKKYILFQCNHVFHTECLERQMGEQKECVVCHHGNPQAKPIIPPVTTTPSEEEPIKNKGKERAT